VIDVSVGCEGRGNVCGCGEGLVRVLVGIIRPNSREKPNRERELYCY
jgi:hypothetical protein